MASELVSECPIQQFSWGACTLNLTSHPWLVCAYACIHQLLCLWPCTVQYAVNLYFLLLITYREHLGLVDDHQVSDSACFDPLSDAFYKVITVLQNATIILRKGYMYVCVVKLSQDMWKKTADMNWDNLKNVCTHWLEFMMRGCFPVALLEYRMFNRHVVIHA